MLRLKCSCNSIESAAKNCRSSAIARKLVVAYCSLLSSENIESIFSLNSWEKMLDDRKSDSSFSETKTPLGFGLSKLRLEIGFAPKINSRIDST